MEKWPYFFRYYLLLLVPSLIALVFVDHGEVVLYINQSRIDILDWSMPWITYLGDGWFYAAVSIIVLFWNWRWGVFFGISGGILSIVVTFFKRIVFGGVPRPKKFFADTDVLQFIEGVDVAGKFSFPSGHSTTVFMLGALLSLWFKNNRPVQLICLFMAILGGFSRIYILQHFYVDVVAGSVLGVLLAIGCWRWLRPLLIDNGLK